MEKYKKYRNGKNTTGFTLVEVLICVGIIGIIAAITIPAILASTSEKALEAQRKALYSRMAQAFGQIKNLKNYEYSVGSKSAMLLVTNGIAKVFKITSTCDPSSLSECGITETITDYYSDTDSTSYSVAGKITLPDYNENIDAADLDDFTPDYAGFRTANGESVLLWYNPRCKSKSEISPHKLMESVCVNMIYDLNGSNNVPNSYGEDIGYITVFYPTDSSVVAPVLYNQSSFSGTHSQMLAKASELDLVPPTIEELVSILVNKNLANITKSAAAATSFWSSSYAIDDSGKVWSASQTTGIEAKPTTESLPYFLIKK